MNIVRVEVEGGEKGVSVGGVGVLTEQVKENKMSIVKEGVEEMVEDDV